MLKKYDLGIIIPVIFLLTLGLVILNSVAPTIFPEYVWYIVLGIFAFLFFSLFDFEVISVFSKYFYILSIFLLLITLVIGQVTRGTVRWIPVGSISIQPSEVIRPLLLVFFANYFASKKLTLERLVKGTVLAILPIFLIIIQPSLGVSILTAVGFLGIFLASDFNKKQLFYVLLITIIIFPAIYFLMAPYQKSRINSFLNPSLDPLGSGYNSIQSTISVGSGMFLGRGLGRGVQTQLYFLPERHTDFIFASVAEEMGFLGAGIILIVTFFLFYRMINFLEDASSPQARAYLAGLFLTMFTQVFVHVGMNMGMIPITGVPYPLVSAGGSSFLATMASLGIVLGTKKS